jgi:hypothetical protein
MEQRVYTFASWLADSRLNERWCSLVDRAMPPFERGKPRDPDEARMLRGMAVPEALIEPATRQPPLSRRGL